MPFPGVIRPAAAPSPGGFCRFFSTVTGIADVGSDRMMLAFLVLIVFPAAMAFAAASDLVSMTISNRIQIVLAVSFVAAAALAGLSIHDIAWHVLAGAMVLTVTFAFFAFGWIGGGDAKLAAATALWFGFDKALLDYLLLGSILGGFLTLGLMLARTHPLPSFLVNEGWALRLHDQKSGIPYGIALAAGALLVLPETFWMTAALR